MQSLLPHIREHFVRQWDRIASDPDQLAQRLARRRSQTLLRPPRPCCIALRAADTRLTALALGNYRRPPNQSPAPLPRPVSYHDTDLVRHHQPHDVRVDLPLIRLLSAPVQIWSPGEAINDVAHRMGCTHDKLRYHLRKGRFHTRKIARLAGKPGRPTLVVEGRGALDPNARGLFHEGATELNARDDNVWGDAWRWHADALPNDFAQSLRRVFIDGSPSDEEVGADADNAGDRSDSDALPAPRAFGSWWWRCPGCTQKARTLYCPVPVPDVEKVCRLWKRPEDELRDSAAPLMTFACGRCHNVQSISRADKNGWNVLVTYLTAGLLYGREVPRPPDWSLRKNTKTRRPNRRPAVRRAEVCDLLVDTDLTRDQIAAKLGLSRRTINMHIEHTFKQYGVHSREELQERMKLIRAKEASDQPLPNAARAIA